MFLLGPGALAGAESPVGSPPFRPDFSTESDSDDLQKSTSTRTREQESADGQCEDVDDVDDVDGVGSALLYSLGRRLSQQSTRTPIDLQKKKREVTVV